LTKLQSLVLATAIGLPFATRAPAAVYRIDPDHSSVALNATHLGIGTVQGRFDRFSGTLEFDPANIEASVVRVRIDAQSINTNQPSRDEHLRSPQFLEVKRYPEIIFESTKVTQPKRNELQILGNLSLHGVTRPVVLTATLEGTATDLQGDHRLAFAAATTINRKDYGIVWNQVVGEGVLVGQVIQIFLDIEAVEQAADSTR
jgi:polyisoprenoid-binding protein YceI